MLEIKTSKIFIAVIFALFAFSTAFGQETAPTATAAVQKIGSIKFRAQVEIDKKTEVLARKRFYLIRGSLKQNSDLLELIRATPVKSPDCYFADLYSKQRVSDGFIRWLKNENCKAKKESCKAKKEKDKNETCKDADNYCGCESVYCREITEEDIGAVPEFADAYRQSLKNYKQQPALALKWLTTYLPDHIRESYQEEQKCVTKKLVKLAGKITMETTRKAEENLVEPAEDSESDTPKQTVCSNASKQTGKAKPKGSQSTYQHKRAGCKDFQSIITDRFANAYFFNIDVAIPQQPVKKPPETPEKGKGPKKTETYLVSNLMPIIFGNKGFVWTCEIEIDPAKPQFLFILKNLIENDKKVKDLDKKKCDAVEKPISEVCDSRECELSEKRAASN